jgi:hypothetical protein
MNSPNIIAIEEMSIALDTEASVTPAKFLPYRKLCKELEDVTEDMGQLLETLDRIDAVFIAIEKTADTGIAELAGVGHEYTLKHSHHYYALHEQLQKVVESAKATLPRKRWDESGCPDDRPDDDDLAREAAAAVPPNDDKGEPADV